MTAVLSGEADIGFMGSESSIYTYQEGANDVIKNFAQLTQRAGNFLVARKEMLDFSWDDLKGKDVLGGRKGGMPEMVFEYILKKNGINPQKDLSINQSIDFGSTAAAFSGGQADYTIEFEPSATALEAENSGYVVASLGVDSGYVPYTAYSAKTSYLNANPNIIQKFTNALQKGMDFVQSHTPEEIAKVIAPQFKETDLATITTIVSRYYEQDTWKSDLIFNEESFNLLQDILENSGELKERVPYEELVTTTFAEKAAHSIKAQTLHFKPASALYSYILKFILLKLLPDISILISLLLIECVHLRKGCLYIRIYIKNCKKSTGNRTQQIPSKE